MSRTFWVFDIPISKVVEHLGTVAELEKKLDGRNPIEWAREYVREQIPLGQGRAAKNNR